MADRSLTPGASPGARLQVRSGDIRSRALLADLAAGPVVALGLPTLAADEGPTLAEGIADDLVVGDEQITVALPTELAARRGFRAKAGEILVVSPPAGPVLVYLGCGRARSLTTDTLRRAAASLVRAAGSQGQALLVLPAGLVAQIPVAAAGEVPQAPAPRRVAQAVAEGAVLAAYRFVAHKSDDDSGGIGALVVAGIDLEPDVLAEGVRRGTVVAEATCFARDLVNEPPSTMTPRRLVTAVEAYLADRQGLRAEVWDEGRIEAERLGGLMGVARGSAEPPRLMHVTFEPPDPVEIDGRVPHVVLVGKGITFDSGGLSLKTPEGMTTMKTDMSGAAAVLAAVGVCAELGVRVRVSALAPITENMPGERAQKPGDVLVARNGATIEVLNTDAEGRLVLADGLSLAAEMKPDAIVDLATLTGACVMALGRSIAGVFSNNDVLVDKLTAAAERAGECTWPLPLAEEYNSDIDSEVADMKNIGKPGQAGAIVAALLLERFVDECAWAHLDIAGPARSDESTGVLTKGATGFGVRTLLEFLERYAADPAPLRTGAKADG